MIPYGVLCVWFDPVHPSRYFFSQVISRWLFFGLNWHAAGFNASCLSCLFLAALWSPVGKGLTSWLPCMWCFLIFCHLPIPYRVLGHVLIVSIPDLCLLLYFAHGQYAVPPVRLKPTTLLSRLKHSTTIYCTRILCGDYDECFRLLLWPWSKRSRSNTSYKCWRKVLSHFS